MECATIFATIIYLTSLKKQFIRS